MADTGSIVEVLGGAKVFRQPIADAWELQEKARKGLPYAALVSLVKRLRLGSEEVVFVFNLKRRTLARRKEARVLHADESDRVLRVARILALAREVFGAEEKATIWLRRTNRALRNRAPLSLLDTDLGAREVENVLVRLERGVIG